MSRRLLILCLLALFAFSSLAAAQRSQVSPSAGDLAGTIKDTTGRVVPNAQVRILGGPQLATAYTDERGKYTLANLIPGLYDVLFSKPGYATVHRGMVQVQAATTTTQDVTFEWADPTTGAAEVVVLDPDRLPLTGAEVDLFLNNALFQRLEVNAAGSAVFAGLPAAQYLAVIRRPGFRDEGTNALRVRAGQLVAVTVRPKRDSRQAGALGGIVRDPDGAPIARAAVKIIDGLTQKNTTTTNAGRYEFTGLIPDDSYAIEISATGFATQVLGNIQVLQSQRTDVPVELVPLQPALGSITGKVTNSQGQELPFTTISVTAGLALGTQVQTGADGRYTLTGLPPADYYGLTATQSGFTPEGVYPIVVAAGRTTVVNFVMQGRLISPGSISGTVREAGSGVLLQNVIVELVQGPSAGLSATTDAAGHFDLDGVTPADGYVLRFRKTNYQTTSSALFTVGIGTNTVVNAELSTVQVNTAGLSGTVRRAGTTNAVSGATVTLFAGPSSPLQTTTDSRGRYAFQNLRPGSGYSLRIAKSGFVTQELTSITLANGTTLTRDIGLQRTAQVATLTGRVLNLIQQPIPGATVRIIEGPTNPGAVTTDATGSFRFETLSPGTYTLEATANGFQTGRRTGIVVGGGDTVNVTLQLLRQ